MRDALERQARPAATTTRCALWLAAIGWIATAGADVVRVDVSSTTLLPSMHAWAIINTDAFASANGYNFSCSNPYDWSGLEQPGVVAYVFGCWQSMLSATTMGKGGGGMSTMLMPIGCMSAQTQRSVFLQRAHTYTVCGVSLWNEYFSEAGSVTIIDSAVSATLLNFQSSTALASSPTGVASSSCFDQYTHRSCTFTMGSVCVGCGSAVDCSAVSDSFCAALNRQPCALVANTCGACEECFLSDDDQLDAVGGSGSGEAGSGEAGSGEAGSGDAGFAEAASGSGDQASGESGSGTGGAVVPAGA